MDGEGEADGTYLNAKEAVLAGILPEDHILKTSKQVRDKAKNQIEGVANATSLRDIMASLAKEFDENKPLEKLVAIHKQKEQNIQQQTEMENMNFSTVCAQLGLAADVAVTQVSGRITDLLKAESDLKNVQSQLAELQIKFQGKEAEVKNINDKLVEVTALLKRIKMRKRSLWKKKLTTQYKQLSMLAKLTSQPKNHGSLWQKPILKW